MFPADFAPYHRVATYGAFLIGTGVLLMIVGWVISAFEPIVGKNPWGSRSRSSGRTPTARQVPATSQKPVVVDEKWTPLRLN